MRLIDRDVGIGAAARIRIGDRDRAEARTRRLERQSLVGIDQRIVFGRVTVRPARSEEHTSELQSLMRTSYAVFCLTTKSNLTRTQILFIWLFVHPLVSRYLRALYGYYICSSQVYTTI